MQTFTRRAPFWGMLALCLAAGALRAADLVLGSDPATGFVSWGGALPRCAALGAVVAAAALCARRLPGAPPDPEGRALPCCLLATGLPPVAGACAALYRAPASPWARAWLAAACAACVGLACLARRAAALRRPVPGVWGALLALPWLAMLAGQRVLLEPAAVERLPATMRVLSIVAALALYAALLRWLYVPSQPAPRVLFAAGFAAFLLGACTELPQALWGAACHTAQPGELPAALAMGAWGCCGLACAWRAAAPQGSGAAQKPAR